MDIFPSPPHMLSSLLQGLGPVVPPSGSSHSTSSPQDRWFLRPAGSPSHGGHTWQHWLMSGTQPTGHLKHGHAPTSHLVAYSSGHTAPAQSRLKRNAAVSRSSCIVTQGAPKSFNRLKSILNVTLHGIKNSTEMFFSGYFSPNIRCPHSKRHLSSIKMETLVPSDFKVRKWSCLDAVRVLMWIFSHSSEIKATTFPSFVCNEQGQWLHVILVIKGTT